jgi:tetratricopeptide (TPR) repeat protein
VQKPEVNETVPGDRFEELMRGPRSGPLAGVPTPASATAIGFAIAGAIPFASGIVVGVITALGGAPDKVISAVSLAASILEIAAILAIVRYGEKRLLGSVGIRQPTDQDLKLGLAFGLGLFLLAILIPTVAMAPSSRACVALGSHLRLLFPSARIPATGGSFAFAILVIAIAAIARELTMRGFAASRLRTMTGSVALGGAGALALDLAAHLPLWGFGFAIVVAPIEAILVGLFLWKRRLLPCVVANFTAGAMVLTLAAVAGTQLPPNSGASRATERLGSAARGPGILVEHVLVPKTSPIYPIVNQALEDSNKGDNTQAIAEMGKAIAKEPNEAYLYSARGVFYSIQNRHAEAIADYTKASSLRPDVDLYWRQRAIEYTHMGDNLSAHRDYAKAIQVDPKDSENYRDRAVLYQSENRYSEALSDIDEAIKLNPGNVMDLSRRAAIHLRMHQYDRAISDCDQIVKLNPSYAGGYGCRYDVYNASGDRPRAIASLGDYLKVSPENVAVLCNRGDLELQLGRWNAARADLVAMTKNIAMIAPEDANWAAMTLATNSHPEARDGKAALALATHACEATGYRNPAYLATLAAAYAESGDFEQASKWQNVAIGLEKNNPRDRAFDLWVLRLYQRGKPLRDNEFPPPRAHFVLKAIAGGIMMLLMLIGLVTAIVWSVQLAKRRRRARQATA